MLHRTGFFLIFMGIFASTPYGSEQSKKESLFEAIDYFEKGDFAKSAQIFRYYVGKPVPVAEPYCLELARQGYLTAFTSVESMDNHPEKKKANLWFETSTQLESLRKKKATQLNTLSLQAEKQENGPLLYLIGTLFESGTQKMKAKLDIAKQLFQLAFQKGDPRAIFGLNRILTVSEKDKLFFDNVVKFSVIYTPLSLMRVANQYEADIFKKISIFLQDKKDSSLSEYFLYKAAQFGDVECQFLWAKSCCADEYEILYWMMQASGDNHLEALGVTGHFFEQGKGAPQNWSVAYKYLQRAANHSAATALDYQNFGLTHELGKGTDIDFEEASLWYGKAYQKNSSDLQIVYDYGRALLLAGKPQEAFPYLEQSKDLNDDAYCNYALCLYHLNKGKGTPREAIEIFKNLTLKGNHHGIICLAKFVYEDETDFDLVLLTKLLEDVARKSKVSKDKVDALLALYNLYDQIKENLKDKKLSLVEKALDLDPGRDETKLLYAKELKKSGRYEEALKYYQELQEQGYYSVYNDIGACYDLMSKQSSEPDKVILFAQQALEYYLKQVEDRSHPDTVVAAYNIYALKLQGRLNEKSGDEELLKYLQMAAEGGDEDALCDLGSVFLIGKYGLEIDIDKAESYYRLAISKGNATAKLNLISLKIFAEMTEKDKEEVKQLLSELLIEDASLVDRFLKSTVQIVKDALKEIEESQTEPISTALPEKPGVKALKTKETIIENKQETIVPKLSRKEKEKLEEEQRLRKKFERLTLKLEDIKDKKQAKFRKIKTLVNQHIHTFSGHLVNGKGSGRRIKLGDQYTGFHQPHTPDLRGGALEGLKKLMSFENQ